MNKLLPFLLFLCLFSTHTYAQEIDADSSKLRLIYLNDGQILMGQMVNFTPDYLVLEEDGEPDDVYFDEIIAIKRITKSSFDYHYLSKGKHFKKRGFFNHTKGGYISGTSVEGNFVHTITGFQPSKKLAFGLGVGREHYEESDVADGGQYIHTFLPVYLQARAYPLDFKISPYVTLAAGYGVPLYSEQFEGDLFSGGLWYHPTIGLRFASKLKTNLVIEFGYISQTASGETFTNNQTTPSQRDFNLSGFTVSGGFLF